MIGINDVVLGWFVGINIGGFYILVVVFWGYYEDLVVFVVGFCCG